MLHTWIILIIVKYYLVQIGRIDGPTKYLSCTFAAIRLVVDVRREGDTHAPRGRRAWVYRASVGRIWRRLAVDRMAVEWIGRRLTVDRAERLVWDGPASGWSSRTDPSQFAGGGVMLHKGFTRGILTKVTAGTKPKKKL
jgi:hypothetical protein